MPFIGIRTRSTLQGSMHRNHVNIQLRMKTFGAFVSLKRVQACPSHLQEQTRIIQNVNGMQAIKSTQTKNIQNTFFIFQVSIIFRRTNIFSRSIPLHFQTAEL